MRPLVGAGLIAAVALWVFAEKASGHMPDFEVYWTAGSRAARAEPLYRSADADYQFKYFPAFAVAARPLAALPLPRARALWFATSVTAFVALLWLAVRALPDRRRPAWWLVVVLIVGLGKYYVEDLVLGQINILLTLVATGAIVAFNARREALGGVLVALAVVIKPYALILLPWLAARGRPRAVGAAAGVLAVASLLPVPAYGLGGTLALYTDWWRTVTATTAGTLTHSDNVSVAALFAKWLGLGAAASWCTAAATLLLLGGAALVLVRRRGLAHPDGLEIGLLLLLTPLVSPQGWDYVLVVATPALAWLANHHDALPRALRLLTVGAVAVIGLSLYDVLGRRLLYVLLDANAITMACGVVVVALWALRARRAA